MNLARIFVMTVSVLIGTTFIYSADDLQEISIAVVPKGTNKERWKAIHEGAMKASKELAKEGLVVNILWKGNLDPDRNEQIQVVDTFTGQRLSGILVASIGEDQFSGEVHVDANSDLPMIYIDDGLDAQRAISYVATDNFQGGAIAADRIGQLMEGVGNVVVVRHRQGDSNTEAREAGFIERIKSRYPSIRLISMDQHVGNNVEKANNVAEYLLNRYGRRLNAVFASSAVGTDAMLTGLRNFNLTEQVHLVGYEASVTSLEAIKSGEIKGLVVSNPYRMGYLGVTTLVDNIQGGNIPTIVDTGVTLVTQSNIDSSEVREALGVGEPETIR
ncbi:MAG: ribose transport system substrate-binding protein [Candidatus Pelagisphaera sp.]|jgi:ribose transport system substrate-binding protein